MLTVTRERGLVALLLGIVLASASFAQIPSPIDPTNGQQKLIDLLDSLPINDIPNALDNHPLPYAVAVVAGGAQPTIVNKNTGSPIQLDADSSKATGKGNSGHDLLVEVNTEPFPTPSLVITVERLGSPSFAEDLTIVVAVPWNAFNDEVLPDRPNLFFGFQTTALFDAIEQEYPPGGHAPESVQFRFLPGVVGGSDHLLELQIDTVGADNPIRFLAGHFDGTVETGTQNALALGALADPVPENIGLTFDIDNSFLFQPTFATSFVLGWESSAPSKVIFDYLENESFPFTISDFGTSLLFDLMPTEAEIGLTVDTNTATATLSHTANAPIGLIEILHRRVDELTVIGTATDVPTMLDVTVDLSGFVTVDVNAPTLDIDLQIIETEGFPGTSAFLGYDLDYVGLRLVNVPDITAGYFPATDSFSVTATNPGECPTCDSIDLVELILDDDGRLDEDGNTVNLELPTSWSDAPVHHIFSLVDDGVHGTAAARILYLENAEFSLDAMSIAEAYTLQTTDAAPMQAYLRTQGATNLIPGHDIEVTCNVDDFPEGTLDFDFDFPDHLEYTITPPQDIDSLACFGHIDSLNFDILAADLPPELTFDFDPDEHLTVLAEDGSGPNTDTVGLLAIRLWDETMSLPGSGALFGLGIRDARARVDEVPSFLSTWSDDPGSTNIDFDTGSPPAVLYLGGAQVSVSTIVELTDQLPAAGPTSAHYARFFDDGGTDPKRLQAGAFGIDQFSYNSSEGGGMRELSVHYAADQARALELEVESAFGGRFFPDYSIDAELTLDAIPQSFDLTTDLATQVDYTGSGAISSLNLAAIIDTTNDSDDSNAVIAQLLATGLPSAVDFDLAPATGASLIMSGPLTSVFAQVQSGAPIFGSPYRLLQASLQSVPAKWTASWAGGSFFMEATDVFDNPSPLGQVAALVSTSNDPTVNDGKLAPFTLPGDALGGPLLGGTSGGCRINYTPFLQAIDFRYYNAGGAPNLLARLPKIYCQSSVLDLAPSIEDHLVVRVPADVDFVSLQFSGFQKVSAEPNANGGVYSLAVPVVGPHPLFVGVEMAGEFSTLQIENVPDAVDVDIDTAAGHIEATTVGSLGSIDAYVGPLPTAADNVEALRIQADDLPTSVEIDWNLAIPGSATFNVSNPFEVRLLSQNGSRRLVGGLVVGDLSASWDLSILDVELGYLDPECIISLIPPVGEVCGLTHLVFADAGFNFTANPGLDGFFNIYDRIGSPSDLAPPSPAPGPGDAQFVPRFTFALENFSHFDVEAGIQQCLPTPIPVPPFVIPCLPPPDFAIGIHLDVGSDLFDGFTFDFWDRGESPGVITGDPDYIGNNPWHVVSPLLHGYGSHFDPFDSP